MIPIIKIKSIVETYKALEKELASGNIDKKDIVKKSKEYSSIKEIIDQATGYLNFEKEKMEIEKIIEDKESDQEMVQLSYFLLTYYSLKYLKYFVNQNGYSKLS